MGIRRGTWQVGNINKTATIKTGRFGARPVQPPANGESNSSTFLSGRGTQPVMPKDVSEFRQNIIRGGSTDGSTGKLATGPIIAYSPSYKQNQRQQDLIKTAQSSSTSTFSFLNSGTSNTVRQGPEVYSPLFQIANLQLPRDRITMNAWNRNFYDTHPLVHNCINLHATYPIGKINIKCKDRKIEQFFMDMVESIDLPGVLQAVALEFWKLGEVFPYATLDEVKGVWRNISVLNPDYVHIQDALFNGGESVLSMKPDKRLLQMVQSNNPADIQLRSQISPEILHHVKVGNNIPLDSFNVSHLKMLSSPYDSHGTSVVVSIYKDLMLYDKLRECYSQDTEILTENGFVSGLELAQQYKNDVLNLPKIACFNSETETVEYHNPINTHISDYTGDMYNFKGKKVDVLVTPEHKMLVKKHKKNGWTDWYLERAKDVSPTYWHKLRSHTKFEEGKMVDFIDVLGKKIPVKLYMTILGHIISEGCVYQSYRNGRYDNSVLICQNTNQPYYKHMRESFNKFGELLGKNVREYINVRGSGYSTHTPKEKWEATIAGRDLVEYFKKETGDESGNCKAGDKRIPRWIFGLHTDLLRILLQALLEGDGHFSISKYNASSRSFRYDTGSKQLADDVYELVYRCGFVPLLRIVDRTGIVTGKHLKEHSVAWSTTNYGNEPRVCNSSKTGGNINIIPYSGKVWCFEVPTGLFITRRNGKITIQGNSKFAQADNLVNPITLVSVGGAGDGGEYHPTEADLEKWRQTFEAAQYDKDFKIISHAGVKIERVGATGAIIDISADMNFILDNILYGLMVPKAVLTQEGASFNSASIGLEVLKQRYESFRNMMSQWLIKKVFAPISEIHEFYDYKDGVKQLIVPEIDWNQMILYDMDNYINVVNGLVQNNVVSKSTLFKSLGLNMDEERRKMKEEMIQVAIMTKEVQLMQRMTLGALRSLKPDEDIIEPTEAPLPGVPGAEESGMGNLGGPDMGMGGGMGMPELGGGGLGMPPMGGGGGMGMPPSPHGGGGGLGGLPLGGTPPMGPATPPAPGGGTPPPTVAPAPKV